MHELVRNSDNRFMTIKREDSALAQDIHTATIREPIIAPWRRCSDAEKKVWKNFVSAGHADLNFISEPIFESWNRCLKAEVDFSGGKCWDLLSGKDFEKRESQLVEAAKPIMETLYQCVHGSDFVLVLIDKDGYILRTSGDLNVLRRAEKLNFGPGANWSERSVGTNAIGTALTIGRALHVTGPEHYCQGHHLWTCSAAPIRDAAGEIVGCLDISGPRERFNPYILAMIVASVKAIEERLRLEQSFEYLSNANIYLSTVFDAVSEGLISVDGNGFITGINRAAAKLFRLHPEELIGKRADTALYFNNRVRGFMKSGKEYCEEELLLNTLKGQLHCIASAKPICNKDGIRRGAVFTISKIKEPSLQRKNNVGEDLRFMFKDIIGESKTMQETIEKAKRVTKSPSTVLIFGESGTGKEIFAQAIHSASDCRQGPFVSLNCGAIPRELVQSELFGYSEGAFTGAKRSGRLGKLELASGGSIFLDEIGAMPLEMQVNLLRVLEEKTIVRVGGNKGIPVDIRIIAATNSSLYEEVKRGAFREDLYYRLNVISITIPPLRERKRDIPLLTNHYIEKLSRKLGKRVVDIDPVILSIFEAYHWPGNVRELINALEYAINLMQEEDLRLDHLPDYLKENRQVKPGVDSREIVPLAILEQEAIRDALICFDGNISKASKTLGVCRNTLYDKIKRYGIAANKRMCVQATD